MNRARQTEEASKRTSWKRGLRRTSTERT